MREGVRRYDPDLVIAPMLTTAIPADIWSSWPCFIIHPGPRGDRGPSSLDWAIMSGAERWGVTVLQANAEMDAGDIWASVEFEMPRCSKSSVYRTEVITGGAVGYRAQVASLAEQLAASPGYPARLAAKGRQLAAAEKQRPLAAYRAAELAVMSRNFSGPHEPYPELRRAFVYKEKPLCTSPHLARHRTHPWPARPGETSAPQTAA